MTRFENLSTSRIFKCVYFTEVYLQNAMHYLNKTWVVNTGGVAAATTWKLSLSAILQGRYGAEFAEFSMVKHIFQNGGVTEARITETERAADV